MFGKGTKTPPAKAPAGRQRATPSQAPASLESVVLRNDFYAAAYVRQMRVNQWLLIALIGAIAIIALQIITRPTPKWIAMDTEGRIIELAPLDAPVMTTAAITAWSERVVREVNTLDYLHWRDQLARVQPMFATTAWERFLAEFEDSGNRMQLEKKRIILEVSTEAARIIQEGVNSEGQYSWKVEVPINIIAHATDQNILKSRQVVHLTVSRVDARVNPIAPVLVRQYVATYAS